MIHRTHSADNSEQSADDLTQIHGIGPAVKHKLNEAGVFTFAQLAKLPTEQLTALFFHMPGWSQERGNDLINQARDLVTKSATVNAPTVDPTVDDNTQHLAHFSVDLLVDNQKNVRRTHVIHIQSGHDAVWAKWDDTQLSNFILENATTRPERIRVEKEESEFRLQSSRENEDEAATNVLVGYLKIAREEIHTQSGAVTHSLVKADESFAVMLWLDMSMSSVSRGTPLQYQAEVHVKKTKARNFQIIGENKGTILSKGLLPLTINCKALSQGSYHLETSVIVSTDAKDPKSSLRAITKGELFSIS